ncbi:MAG: protein kinase [Pirellulaceae bacterium]|nr:protein kinase [Pirellulaceae bacterium]
MLSQNLLFGLLAFLNEFVKRDQLLKAFSQWSKNPSSSLGGILVAEGYLSQQDHDLLITLVERLQGKFGSDEASIANLPSVAELCDQLFEVAKSEGVERTVLSKTLDATRHSLDTVPLGSSKKPTAAGHSTMERFSIVNEVARGGLGIVYKAQDDQLRRQVALKQIRDDKADEAIYRQKFQREAELTGQLEHPGIVPIYALGTDGFGRPFYAMRFIRGESLSKRIESFHHNLKSSKTTFDSPELRQLLRRFIDVCNAVEYAHERGVLHRDLKPDNIMLGNHGETLVVDWGLAKPLPTSPVSVSDSSLPGLQEPTIQSDDWDSATRHGSVVGTIVYAPPEQLRGELDRMVPASDVYSLGATLYHVLVGKPPIESTRNIDRALKQIADLQNHSPRDARNDIPKQLAFICKKALKNESSERYRSVRELRDDVQRWLDDQAIDAMQEPLSAKAGRWIRQHQAVSSSIGVGSMIAMVLLGVLFVREQKRAESERKLLVEQREANSKLQESNQAILLSSANLARSRGQYREAAKSMRTLQTNPEFMMTSSQSLLLVRDLYFSEDMQAAIAEAEKLDRTQLAEAEQSQFDLLFGDMLLMTKRDASGNKLIQQALASNQLSRSDAAYAAALIAKSADDSIRLYGDCLEADAYNSNALARRGITCAIVGRVQQAIDDADLGLRLFPNDIRFAFLKALSLAMCGHKDEAATALNPLRKQGGYEAEVEMIDAIGELYTSFENAMQSTDDGQMFPLTTIEFLKIMHSLGILISRKYGENSPMVPQQFAWMGELYKAIPGAVELLSIETGFTSLDKPLKRIHEIIPDHQLLNYIVGLQRFGDPDWAQTYKYFSQAAQADVIFADLQRSAAWCALASLVLESISAEKPVDQEQLTQVMPIIYQWRVKEGKYSTAPVPAGMAFNLLLRSGLYTAAKELAEQEAAASSDAPKQRWQELSELASLQQQLGRAVNQKIMSVASPETSTSVKNKITTIIEDLKTPGQ